MTDLNFIYFIILCLLKFQMILSITCCNDITCSNVKNCSKEFSHCILAGKPLTNKTLSKFMKLIDMQLTHFGCWVWPHEVNLCPQKSGECFSVHNHTTYKTFCCAGDLCNRQENLTCEVKNNDITWNSSIFSPDKSTPKTDSNSNTVLMLTNISIILVSTIIGVVVTVFLIQKLKFAYIRRLLYKRPTMVNGVSYVSDRATYISKITNDDSSINQHHVFSNEIFKASHLYEKCEKKSIGKFGEIWIGKLKIGYKEGMVENVAIKIFRPRDESSWETELEMYRYTRNRCSRILTYVGCDKITKYNEVEELWLVTQYIEHGSLHDYLMDAANARPKWSQVLRTCLDIAGGLSYLHEDGSYQISPHISGKPSIAHRDLKSRNILIKGDWNACIADLGLAISFNGNPSPMDLHLQVGTQRYMAPEVLEGAINFSRDSFLGIDIYAMGLIMWEIFSQCINFEGLKEHFTIDTPRYVQPFEVELGSHISMESLQALVVNENKRPQMPAQYVGFEDGLALWKTIVECWDRDAEARLSSSCVYERCVILSRSLAASQDTPDVLAEGISASQDCEPLL